jgi:membrane-associated phospholipid phosphatase
VVEPDQGISGAQVWHLTEVICGAFLFGMSALLGLYLSYRPGINRVDRWAYSVVDYARRSHLASDITKLGSTPVLIVGLVIVFATTFQRDRVRAVACTLGPLLAVLLSEQVFKPLVDRYIAFDELTYPSGTVTAITALVVAAVIVTPGLYRIVSSVLAAAAVGAVSVAVLALRWHFLTDVIGGICLGAGTVLAVDGFALLSFSGRWSGHPGPQEPLRPCNICPTKEQCMTEPSIRREQRHGWKRTAYSACDRWIPTFPFRFLPPRQTVRMAYNVVLDREPDDNGMETYSRDLTTGALTRHGLTQALAYSEEFRREVPLTDVLLSMHLSRSEFVRGLPEAKHILDLGGTHQGFNDGALVHLGYPYPFDRLVVVDLPSDERHEIYQGGSAGEPVQSELGPVEFEFHSMVDLSRYADESFDLVYSGQSIEHVTERDGDAVVTEVYRVLRPGGWFCLDTPNGPAWRVRSSELMNDDHEIEYSAAELESKLIRAGFEVRETKGLNLMRRSLERDEFDELEASANPGVFSDAANCLLLAFVCRKPVR